MSSTTPTGTDLLVQLSRRNLWVALTLLVLLGANAIAVVAFPESKAAAVANKLMMLLPVMIAIAVAALRASERGASTAPSNPAMKAILHDELRQASLARAYRNGFMAMMLVQPLLALMLTWTSVASPAALMAGASVLIGAAVFLASFLYYDR
jgi:hypothetical protein